VAVSGDAVVVAADREDSNATGVDGNEADNSATDSGAAYVFTRTAGVWRQRAYLKASNTDAFDSFGFSRNGPPALLCQATRSWWVRLARTAVPPE
jgi:hypothetical protein